MLCDRFTDSTLVYQGCGRGLDASVVRALLVPAAMKLLGRWNWYLPETLRRAMRLRPALGGAPLPAPPRAPGLSG